MGLLDNILSRVDQQGQKLIMGIKQELVSAGKTASGALVTKTRGESKIVGTRVLFEGSAPTHYIFVDKGRRPGAKQPPVKPIQEWIKQKGLDLNAFAVAKSIAKKGITPTNIYTDGIEKFKKELRLNDLIVKEVRKEIKINKN